VRKFLFVVLTSLATMGVHAWEPSTDDSHPEGTFALPPYAEAVVTIAPVPMPGAVLELSSYSPHSTSLRQAKKVKAAKVARAKSMMSRSAREQMALSRTVTKTSDRELLDVSDDEDDDFGVNDQDLHRSFSQPKVAKTPNQTDDDDNAVIDLPDHIKLRLLIARTKAVDAYILSQAAKASGTADEDLSDMVKLRLLMARTRAVKAHSDKFGSA
jgi:hypothetical protein